MDQQIEGFVGIYTEASQNILALIQSTDDNLTKRRQMELLKEIGVIISSAQAGSAALIVGVIETAYKAGSIVAAEELRIQGVNNIDAKFTAKIHREAVQVIVDEAFYNILEATDNMSVDVKQRLATIIQKANQVSLIEGVSRREATKRAIAEATERGITGIVARNGAKIPVEKYLAASVQYHQRKAHVDGMINRATENKQDLVYVNSVGITCSICAQYQGRVYSISGNDSRFPKLDMRPPYHAHCVHSAYPWNEEYQDKEDVRKMLKDSNRPFVDNRTETNIRKYDKLQRETSRKNQTRKQWIKYKSRMPDLPDLKTFARHKAMDSPKYREWLEDFRLIGIQLK